MLIIFYIFRKLYDKILENFSSLIMVDLGFYSSIINFIITPRLFPSDDDR